VLINKIKRDSKIVKELKAEYNNVCQICGEPIIKIKNLSYSEACHIHPRFQNGSDTKSNLLILCPNHHVLFDIGVITINPEDCKTLIHIEKDNELNGMELKVIKHSISSNYVRYHFENIYLPIAKAIMGK